MSVPMALLGLLDREPSHGYDLKRDYDTYFGRGRPLPFGQVYATLARLARAGLVAVAQRLDKAMPEPFRYADEIQVAAVGGFDRIKSETEMRTVGLFFAMLLVR